MGYYQDLDEDRFGPDDFERELVEIATIKVANQAHQRYNAAKTAAVGATIACAGCAKLVVKATYHNKFCSTKCKDVYHNLTNPRGFGR